MADLVAEEPLPLGPQQLRMGVMVDAGDGVLSPTGEGEILLVGPQVADGYLPASHPGNASFGWYDGLRSYRTGDFGRVDEDGGLTIHGRIDGQVKVNGYRVELGEIERNAIQVEGVKMAIALQASEGAVTRGLILVLQGQNLGEATIANVRNHLRQKLPAFMIPAKIVTGDNLPISLAGKIDRRAVRDRFGMV
jgi:D-alanine--poly(phosphoribitol) ligase subunit 1